MTINKDTLFRVIKFSFMLVLGIVITINPNSLLSILLFVTGVYLTINGFYSLVSTLSLIKYRKGWVYEGVKTFIMLSLGSLLLFNSSIVATTIYGVVSVVIGLLFIFVGIMAIARTKEASSGIFFVVIGILIAIFPLGFSYLITRGIGISLIVLSAYLLYSLKSRSS